MVSGKKIKYTHFNVPTKTHNAPNTSTKPLQTVSGVGGETYIV
jgi:hypothetical protein